MTSITEFILARVAEDEKEARAMDEDLRKYPPSTYEMAQVPMLDMGTPERALAECEAKRRIVEWAAPILENWPNAPKGWRYISDDGMDVLKILAAIWSDHADYEEGWR